MYINLINAHIQFNDFAQDVDTAQVAWNSSRDYMPLYGYKSVEFDALAPGNIFVNGFITMNFLKNLLFLLIEKRTA